MAKNRKKRFNFTIFVYFVVIFSITSVILIASSKVLFRPWTARTFSTTVKLGNQVFLLGGVDEIGESRDEIMMIDMDKMALYRIGHLPQPVYSGAAAVQNGVIYLAGGISDKQYQDNIYQFDPESKLLTLIGKLPGPRAFGSLSAFGDHLYYFGGFDGEELRSDIIEINPQTGNSAVKANLAQPLEYHRSITVGSRIFIIGGENGHRQYTSTVSVYSPADNQLSEMKDLAEPVVRFAVTEIVQAHDADEIVIAGGWGNGQSNRFTRIVFEEGSYTEQYLGAVGEAFSDLDLVSYNNFLYLIGGVHPELKRQIRVLKIDPEMMEYEDIQLKSFAWQ